MKVRFWKGPWHRRIADVDPAQVGRGGVTVAILKPGAFAQSYDINATTSLHLAPNHDLATYDVKWIPVTLGGVTNMVPAVHPDGLLYLEYVKPRRN